VIPGRYTVIAQGFNKKLLRGCLESIKQVIFILGNREQGTGNTPKDWEELGRIGEHTKNNKIQYPPLTRGGLGWGQTIFDTLIMTYQTSS
jgi:hypothetical protein